MDCPLHNKYRPDIPDWVRISDQRTKQSAYVHDRAIWQIKDGKRIKYYNSITEAQKDHNKKSFHIYDALKRGTKCWGYHWEYADEEESGIV